MLKRPLGKSRNAKRPCPSASTRTGWLPPSVSVTSAPAMPRVESRPSIAWPRIRPVPPAIGAGGGPPNPGGTGLILGQAIDGLDSTRGIAGALVTLTLGGSQPVRVLADGQGRFAFRDLPKGRFNITASRPGYVDGAYGRLRPGGQTQSVDLADGDRISNVNVAL